MDFAIYSFALEAGAQAKLLLQSKLAGGHGGAPIRPRQIDENNLWLSGEWMRFAGEVLGEIGLIDLGAESVAPLGQLSGLAGNDYSIQSYATDGTWVSVRAVNSDHAWVINLTAPETRWLVDGQVVAWQVERQQALVFVVDEEGGAPRAGSLVRLDLNDGSRSTFVNDLGERRPEVVVSRDRVYVNAGQAEIKAYDLEGMRLDHLFFPEGVGPSIHGLQDDGLVVAFEAYAFQDQGDDLCRKQGLWLWQP